MQTDPGLVSSAGKAQSWCLCAGLGFVTFQNLPTSVSLPVHDGKASMLQDERRHLFYGVFSGLFFRPPDSWVSSGPRGTGANLKCCVHPAKVGPRPRPAGLARELARPSVPAQAPLPLGFSPLSCKVRLQVRPPRHRSEQTVTPAAGESGSGPRFACDTCKAPRLTCAWKLLC